tara:strand:- start:156 stop:1118 length:963 start_codon:yes stop_codon:yes gene_type:complete
LKILFITIKSPKQQGDYFELAILNGLKKILGNNIIDYPKKKIIYGDYSEVSKEELHGRGFSLLRTPFIDDIDRDIKNKKFDAVIYGDGHMYGEEYFVDKYDSLANNNVWIIDGHDLSGLAPKKTKYLGEEIIGNQFKNSFKGAVVYEEPTVFPTNLGVPEEVILPIDLSKKNKMFQTTYPKYSFFENPTDLGGGSAHYKFTSEEEYYDDLATSWFGLSSKRGSWDALRNYEIIASGSLLIYRDYLKKPISCSPRNVPCLSYSTKKDLYEIFDRLIKDNKPTDEYMFLLEAQREWLINYGTTSAIAKNILEIIKKNPIYRE